MINSAAPKNFTDTAALKRRFQEVTKQSQERQEVVDKLDRMAEAFLVLDGTKHDQDDAPGSVAVGNDKLIAFVQAHPFGGALSMDVLDERGPEKQEYSIQTDLFGKNYAMDVGGVTHEVYQSGNGMLALMAQISELMPDKGEEAPEAGAPDGADKPEAPQNPEAPQETDTPEHSEKPKDSDKPGGADKPKGSDKPKKSRKPRS